MRENTETSTITPWDALSDAIKVDTVHAETVDVTPADFDLLVDYHRGRLDAHAIHQLQQRLVASPALAAELLDLKAFATTATHGPDPSLRAGIDVPGAWEAFGAKLDRDQAETRATAQPAVVVDLGARRRLPRPSRTWWVAAAAAVLAVIGLRALSPDTPAQVTHDTGSVIASFESGAPDDGWTVVAHNAASESPTAIATSSDAPAVDAERNPPAPTRGSGNLLLDADFESQDDWHVVSSDNA